MLEGFWAPDRTCSGLCKKFRVIKPRDGGRYEAGHARCQTCDIWVDHNGCHFGNGFKATAGSDGWYCDCCNFKVRMHPRQGKEKSRLHVATVTEFHAEPDSEDDEIDLEHFSNRRARMLKILAGCIPRNRRELDESGLPHMLIQNKLPVPDIEEEFGCKISRILDFAYAESPNKISMTVEFEHIKSLIKKIPTIEILGHYSRFDPTQYEAGFGSMGQLLNRLGYDPWYRDSKKTAPVRTKSRKPRLSTSPKPQKPRLSQSPKPRITKQTGLGELNRLIDRSMYAIRSSKNGMTLMDLCTLLDISFADVTYLVKRLTRVDGVSVIRDGNHKILIWNDIGRHDEPSRQISDKPDPTKATIPSLVDVMMDEHRYGGGINKRLRQRLTQEFVACKSMAQVIQNNPDIGKKDVMRYVRTSLRLPPKLKDMENRGDLHPDPDLSLRIALFAVNQYGWDGQKESEDDVVDMAKAISKYVARNPVRTGRRRG